MNDMDAFKELQKRAPDVALMNIDELHGMIFWAGAARKWATLQISLAEEIGGLSEQIDAWYRDGSAANDLEFEAKQRRGELAKKEPRAAAGGRASSPLAPVANGDKPPKWQRLGYKSEKDMRNDQFILNNPKAVKEVKKEAKENKEYTTVTAIKNKVRAKKAEKAADKYKKEVKENTKATTGDALKYLSKLREIVTILPAKVPAEGWTDESYAEAKSMVEIIQKRLGVWNE